MTTGRAVSAQLLGSSIYETWVKTLRAWAADPMTPLGHLPPIADDTFTPETFARLVTHITAALESASARWTEALAGVMERVTDEHDLARELVDLRSVLARRAQLSHHPSLPPGAREPFEENLRQAVERYQRQLEEGFATDSTHGRLERGHRERLLAVIRRHPFTAVLEYDLKQDGSRLVAPALDARMPPGPPQPHRRRWRTLSPQTSTETP